MKEYEILSGEWTNAEHTEAFLHINIIENGDVVLEDAPFNLVLGDMAEATLALVDLMSHKKIRFEESEQVKVLTGKLSPPMGKVVYDGALFDIEDMKKTCRSAIVARIDKLNSGYALALSERNLIYDTNRRKKIENLFELEELVNKVDLLAPRKDDYRCLFCSLTDIEDSEDVSLVLKELKI
jgi:hypothetical protein